VNSLLETLKSVGAGRLLAMGMVAAGLLTAFAMLGMRLSQPQMAMLYGDLEMAEAGNIVTKLEAQNIPVEVRGNGSQVFVPADQVLRLRMSMAEAGLPSRGTVGYELFDRSEGLGTTSFVQNINQVRALEGELARTIRSLDRVGEARVHLVLPRRELFSRQAQQPSASIVVRMRGAGRMEREQVQAIQHLVASAVPEMKPEFVAVVDERGTLLSRAASDGPAGSGQVAELRRAHELQLKQAIESLVEQSLGLGKVRVEVTADMNFDRITTNAESFDPEARVARSTQNVEERQQSQDKGNSGTVTVKNNLPEGQTEQPEGPQSQNTTERTEETVNYEISKTITTKVHESGTVKKLSVAVLVDGTYAAGTNGERQYQPRNEEELKQIAALVRSAIGYDEARGDRVEVVNMRFVQFLDEGSGQTSSGPAFDLGKADYMRIAEIAAFVLVGLLLVLLVLRPLLLRKPDAAAPGPAALPGARPLPQLAAPAGAAGQAVLQATEASSPVAAQAPPPPAPAIQESMIDIARIEGQVKASSLRKLGELVDKHPEEAVSIIRSWMYQRA